MISRPLMRRDERDDGANRGRLDDGAERVAEVDAGPLGKALDDPSRLVPLERAVGVQFVLEDPLAADDVDAVGMRNQFPSVVGTQGIELHLHRGAPVRVA